MDIKSCLITAAGFGTRMGQLGKSLPKPLWPIGNLTLLDLQVEYVKKLGIENIYVNIHHQADQIIKWSQDKDVILLHEQEILGSGGCVHNLIDKTEEDGNLLIVNSDQFYFFDLAHIEKALIEMRDKNAVAHLFAIEVNKKEKYNETVICDGVLKNIVQHTGTNNYLTYSGVGIVSLDKIVFERGKSGFFESVCDYNSTLVQMSLPQNCEFWDFGTLDKYFDSSFDLVESDSELLREFLENAHCEVNLDEYGNIEMTALNLKLIRNSGSRKIIHNGEVITL